MSTSHYKGWCQPLSDVQATVLMARRPSAFIQSSGRRVGLSPFSRCVAGGPCELLLRRQFVGATCGAIRGVMRGVTFVDVHVTIYRKCHALEVIRGNTGKNTFFTVQLLQL